MQNMKNATKQLKMPTGTRTKSPRWRPWFIGEGGAPGAGVYAKLSHRRL